MGHGDLSCRCPCSLEELIQLDRFFDEVRIGAGLVVDHRSFPDRIVADHQIDDLKISGVTSTDAEALEIPGRGGTEVVVIDMALSGIDTLDLIERIRVTAPSARLLVVTASDDPHDILVALDAGADGF